MTDLRKLAEDFREADTLHHRVRSPISGAALDEAREEYLAACSPATIIALLDRAERAEMERDAFAREIDGLIAGAKTLTKQRDEARAALELRNGGTK